MNNNYDDSLAMQYLLENIKIESMPTTMKIPKVVLDGGKYAIDSYVRVLLVDCYEITYDKKRLVCGSQLVEVDYKHLEFEYGISDATYDDDSYVDCKLDVIIPTMFIACVDYNCIKYVDSYSANEEERIVNEEKIIRQEIYERICQFMSISIVVRPIN